MLLNREMPRLAFIHELELAFDEWEGLGDENEFGHQFQEALLAAAESLGLAGHAQRCRDATGRCRSEFRMEWKDVIHEYTQWERPVPRSRMVRLAEYLAASPITSAFCPSLSHGALGLCPAPGYPDRLSHPRVFIDYTEATDEFDIGYYLQAAGPESTEVCADPCGEATLKRISHWLRHGSHEQDDVREPHSND